MFDVDVEFRIGGRKVHPNQIANEWEKAIMKEWRDDFVRKLRGIRDLKTGERPKIIVKGRSLSNLTIEVEGSKNLIDEVNRRVG